MTTTGRIAGACLAAALAVMSPTSDRLTAVGAKPEKVSGYAEFKRGDTLIVDGQRIVSGPKARAVKDIPLGYEVTVTGRAVILAADLGNTRMFGVEPL